MEGPAPAPSLVPSGRTQAPSMESDFRKVVLFPRRTLAPTEKLSSSRVLSQTWEEAGPLRG